jgi:hypothetical protein
MISNYQRRANQLAQQERADKLKSLPDFQYVAHSWEKYKPQKGEVYQFIFWDPYYAKDDQPAGIEWVSARAILDAVSEPGTVLMVMGKPDILMEQWVPQMKKKRSDKTVKWHVDPNNYYTIRSESRTCGPAAPNASKNAVDFAVIFVRMETKEHRKAKLPDNWIHFDQVADMFPAAVHGNPRYNVYREYRPPTCNERLKDEEGHYLRPKAERTIEWCEHMILRFTQMKKGKPGRVLDLQAGTGCMGMACLKHDRGYYGCDQDPVVIKHGFERLSRFLSLIACGIVQKNAPTMLTHVKKKQIAGYIPLLPSNNRPLSGFHIPVIAENPGANFGDFRDQTPGDDFPPLEWNHEVVNTLFHIKQTNQHGVTGIPVGLGVFSVLEWKAGDKMPIFFWGDIMDIPAYNAKYRNKKKVDHPMRGAICLEKPFVGYLVELDKRCPASYINDYKSLAKEPNVKVVQTPQGEELEKIMKTSPHFGLQQLLQLVCLKSIAENDQLLLDYGSNFWSASELSGTHIEAGIINAKIIAEAEESDDSVSGGDDDEEDKKEGEEEKKSSSQEKPRKRKKSIIIPEGEEEELLPEEDAFMEKPDSEDETLGELIRLKKGKTNITPTKTKESATAEQKEAAKKKKAQKEHRKADEVRDAVSAELKKSKGPPQTPSPQQSNKKQKTTNDASETDSDAEVKNKSGKQKQSNKKTPQKEDESSGPEASEADSN